MTVPPRIEKLDRTHAVAQFASGEPDLDRFLIRHALQAQSANSSQTYLAVIGEAVTGYYTLVVGQVERAQAPLRVYIDLPRDSIPLLILSRLAVHKDWRGRGLGAGLLRDALSRTLQAAGIVGASALAVHAKDDAAVAFCKHFEFKASPTDARHLFFSVKDVRTATGR